VEIENLKVEVTRLREEVGRSEAVVEAVKEKYWQKKEELDNLAHQFAMFKAARAEVLNTINNYK
jgi:hypothetical protein